jgi:type I restriction enzyme M protein
MFYNTGIATYIWVLTNRKPEHREGKVQLIDATRRFTPRRKNLGAKNADLSEADQRAILDEFLAFKETETSKIFPTDAFGYRKVIVDRPSRLRVTIPAETPPVGEDLVSSRSALEASITGPYDALPEPIRNALQSVAREVDPSYGRTPCSPAAEGRTWTCDDYAVFETALTKVVKKQGIRLTATLKRQIQAAIAERDETAQPIVKKRTYDTVEYEPDPELRDTEQIPLSESVEDFMAREVFPYAPDAWVADGSEKIGYEISFTRYFYKPQQLRTLAEIEADIRALERETDGLLEEIFDFAN